ncbi:MAG: histidine kinase [Burkholderiaceae bacterium]
MAREIHDDIGGMLTALRFDLDWMSRHSRGEIAQRAQQALDTVGQAMLASQRISRNLRPPVLEAGVVAAIEWQVGQFRKRTGLRATFSSNVDRATLDDARAIAVYRCVQEALTNIVKHANARSVSVDLILRNGQLSIEVTDDGRGLGQTDLNKPASFGLRGLSERARAVDGWLDVLPSAEGTTILLTIPLDGARPAAEALAS